jgi:hypothetical protein
VTSGKAPSDKPTFQPYRGKPAVRNDREGRGNVGIIRSPIRASILPDCGGREVTRVPTANNFTLLTSLDWQVHVYGDAAPEIHAVCDARKLPLHVFPWRPETGRIGLRRNAVYLVRPDGYVALADAEGSATVVASYLDTRNLTSARAAQGNKGHDAEDHDYNAP